MGTDRHSAVVQVIPWRKDTVGTDYVVVGQVLPAPGFYTSRKVDVPHHSCV